MRYVRILFAAASLTACGDAPRRSGNNAVVVVGNSTDIPDIMVTFRVGDTEIPLPSLQLPICAAPVRDS